MKHSFFKSGIFVAAITFLSVNVYGQQDAQQDTAQSTNQQTQKSTSSNSERLVGTYLDVSRAKTYVEKHSASIKNNIYKLQVVVENFGDDKDKSSLKEILDEHVSGKKDFFKRQYLSAGKTLKEVSDKIHDLL